MRTIRNLGLALGIVAAIIWLPIALAAIIILLAAILYRLAQPAPSRSAASLLPISVPVRRSLSLAAIAVAAVIVVALPATVARASGAAVTSPSPLLWTPKQANETMVSGSKQLVATYDNPTSFRWDLSGRLTVPRGYSFYRSVSGADCRGLGRATKGRYSAFVCNLRMSYSPSEGVRTGTYWVRSWGVRPGSRYARRFACASDRALAACPPRLPAKPLPGDPRDCNHQGVEGSASCIVSAAEYAAKKHFGFRGVSGLGCLASSAFVYRCVWGYPPPNITPPGVSTVTFARSKTRWTTTVTVTS